MSVRSYGDNFGWQNECFVSLSIPGGVFLCQDPLTNNEFVWLLDILPFLGIPSHLLQVGVGDACFFNDAMFSNS